MLGESGPLAPSGLRTILAGLTGLFFIVTRHPLEMDGAETDVLLTYMAVERRLAASNRNQALSAILFLYRSYYDL